MKKILLAVIITAAGCGKVPPAAKDYTISQKEIIHEVSSVYAAKEPAKDLFSQVSGKSDTEVSVTGDGIFADVNLSKHFKNTTNYHFSLSLVMQPDGKATVTITPAEQAKENKDFSNAASFEAEFTRGSFEGFKAGKDITLNPTAKGRETLSRQVEGNVKTALASTARFFSARLDKEGKKYNIGEVRIYKLSLEDCKVTGNAKRLEFTNGRSEIEASVIISVRP